MVTSLPDESPISIYELCAAILMACIATEWSRGKHRIGVLCVGNQAALVALVKWSSSSELGTLMAPLFWSCLARGNALWWIEYVHTKSNVADAPSRDCSPYHDSERQLGIGEAPTAFREPFGSWEALHREAAVVLEQ